MYREIISKMYRKLSSSICCVYEHLLCIVVLRNLNTIFLLLHTQHKVIM